jgi:hypothetical protein
MIRMLGIQPIKTHWFSFRLLYLKSIIKIYRLVLRFRGKMNKINVFFLERVDTLIKRRGEIC